MNTPEIVRVASVSFFFVRCRGASSDRTPERVAGRGWRGTGGPTGTRAKRHEYPRDRSRCIRLVFLRALSRRVVRSDAGKGSGAGVERNGRPDWNSGEET